MMTFFLRASLLLCCWLALPASESVAATDDAGTAPAAEPAVTTNEPVSEPAGQPTVAYMHIDGEINPLMARYVERSMEQIEAMGAETVVVHITSFGGRVDSAYAISQQLLGAKQKLLAFVDGEAISAGAMIAYSCHEVHLTSRSIIGDIGVVFQGGEGGVQFASEKIETFVRNYLDLIALNRSWDRSIITKMCNRDQSIYQIRPIPDDPDSYYYVLSDELDTVLADSGLKEDDSEHVVLTKWRADKLITLPATEAVKHGMATALVDDIEAFYSAHGIDSSALNDLRKTGAEEFADLLAGWAPMLAGLAVLFIVFEMKTPGVGLFAMLAGICGVAFLFCQYYLDLAGNIEVVLIAVGLLLILVEVFTMVSGGVLAAIGALIGMAGLVLAFMPNSQQFDFDSTWGYNFGQAMRSASLAMFISLSGIVIVIWRLPQMKAIRRIAVTGEISGNSGGSIEARKDELIGRIGTTTCSLHPGGQVRIDGRTWSASSATQGHIAADTAVIVRSVRMGELVVEEHSPTEAEPGATA